MPPAEPINAPSVQPSAGAILPSGMALEGDQIVLSFSGGGARAAAFSYGVLEGLRAMAARGGDTLLDRVALVTGVSGGSISAAWLGLHGASGLEGFRAAYLDKDWQSVLHTNPAFNFYSLAEGGMNSAADLTGWLDDNVFHGARMAELGRAGRPAVLINATDLYNRAPFVFTPEAFRSLCSDLGSVRVADAVGASMGVPLVFRPIVAQAFPAACAVPLPDWATHIGARRDAPLTLRMMANAYATYRDPKRLTYVHLFDGGVIDNFGLSGLLVARLSSETPYGPIEARDAVRLHSLIFLVVDAGEDLGGAWAQTLEGPDGEETGNSSIGSAMDSSKRAYYDMFRLALKGWQADLRAYRCALPRSEVLRLRGSLKDWRCNDIALSLDTISFADLPKAEHDELSAVETLVSLPKETIDHLIAGGEAAARLNPAARAAMAGAIASAASGSGVPQP